MNCKNFARKLSATGLLAAMLAGVLLSGQAPGGEAQAASKSQLKSRLSELKAARAEADAAVKALQGKSAQYSEKIAALDYQVQTTQDEISATEDMIETLDGDIEEKTVELDKTTRTLEDKKDLFSTRIRVMYENGDTSYMEVLLNSENFSDMLSNMEIVSQIMDYDKRVVQEYTDLKASIEVQKAELEGARAEKQDYADDLKASKRKLEDQKSEYKKLKAKVDGDIKLQKAEAERMLAEQESINAEIERISREEAEAARKAAAAAAAAAKKKNQQSSTSSGSSSSYASTGKVYTGDLTWPCPQYKRVSDSYGWRIHPISGTRKFHKGTDISASKGAPVLAAKGGTVVKSYFSSSYGNYIVVSHGGGLMTAYAHMTRRMVSVGDSVSAGQQIGTVGSTGNSTGPHLHFEVYVNGSAVNPLNYFN